MIVSVDGHILFAPATFDNGLSGNLWTRLFCIENSHREHWATGKRIGFFERPGGDWIPYVSDKDLAPEFLSSAADARNRCTTNYNVADIYHSVPQPIALQHFHCRIKLQEQKQLLQTLFEEEKAIESLGKKRKM